MLVIDDRATFEKDFGLEAEMLRDPLAFLDEGRLVAPWPAMSSLAHQAAVARSRDLLCALELDEQRESLNAIYGYYLRTRVGELYVSPREAAEDDREDRQARDIARRWCGAAALDRHNQIETLRHEIARIGEILDDAIEQLRSAGLSRQADKLRKRLGVAPELARGRPPEPP